MLTVFYMIQTLRIATIFTTILLHNANVASQKICPSMCVCSKTATNCSKRNLSHVPSPISRDTRILDLSGNQIEFLPPAAFGDLKQLQVLNCSRNNITNIHGLSSSFRSLKILDLEHNHLKTINMIHQNNMPELQLLNVGYNDIEVLISLFDVKHSLNTFPKLKILLLHNNKIVQIKMFLSRFRSLQKLVLSHNRLRDITAATFLHIEKLEELHLDHNRLRKITKSWIPFKPNLKLICLAYNHIESVQLDSFHSATNINYIDLSYNLLSHLDNGMFLHLHNLTSLDLSNNIIDHISESTFAGLNNLLSLNLSANHISTGDKEMDIAFIPLKSLNVLDLSRNNALLIPSQAFQGLMKLRDLYLNENDVKIIEQESFSKLANLKYLSLHADGLLCDCSVKWFKDWIGHKVDLVKNISVMCSTPKWLKHKNIVDVQDTELICVPNDMATVRPKLTMQPNSRYVNKEANTSLRCTATSARETPMVVLWYHNGDVISESHVITTKQRLVDGRHYERTSYVAIEKVSDVHAGVYWCRVANIYGSDRSVKVNVSVVEPPRLPDNLLSHVIARSGEDIHIPCTAKGRPLPNVKFKKLNIGPRFHAVVDNRITYENSQFGIRSLKIEDSGLYSCIATNVGGSVNRTLKITVIEKPKFTHPMLNKAVSIGATAVFDCIVSGNPPPKIQWYKNGSPLYASTSGMKLSNQLLVIVSFQYDDEALYACEATNRLGTARQTAQLAVKPSDTTALSSTKSPIFITVIVITVIAVVVLTSLVWVALICFCCKKRRQQRLSKALEMDSNVLGDIPKSYTLRCNGALVTIPKCAAQKDEVHLLGESKEDSDYSTLDSILPFDGTEDDSGISLVYPKYRENIPELQDHFEHIPMRHFMLGSNPLLKKQTPKVVTNEMRLLSSSALRSRQTHNEALQNNNKRNVTVATLTASAFQNRERIDFDPTRLKYERDAYVTSSSGVESCSETSLVL